MVHSRPAVSTAGRRRRAFELGFKRHVPVGYRLLMVPEALHDNMKDVVAGMSVHSNMQSTSG